MTALLLFASTFALVFLLGLQSQFVNRGRSIPAFFISFAIGGGNLILFKLAPSASGAEIAAYLCGGPLGIVSAVHFFNWVHRQRFGHGNGIVRGAANGQDDAREGVR